MAAPAMSSFNKILMITLIVLWGSSFVVVKIVLREGLTPISIATFRFLVAGGLFLVWLLVKRQRDPTYGLIGKEDAPRFLLLALTGVTFFFGAQYAGIQMAGASIAAILVCLLSPVLIATLSALLFNELLTKRQILGIGLAGLGASLVVTAGGLGFSTSDDFFLGTLILLLTPFLWAVYSLLGKRMMKKYDPFLAVAYVTMLGGLCLVPFSLVEGSLHRIFNLGIQGWLAILFLALACSLLGYYIWFRVLKEVGAAVTSSFLFAEPLVTVLLAVLFVDERLSWPIVSGGVLIFLGVYLVTMKQMPQLSRTHKDRNEAIEIHPYLNAENMRWRRRSMYDANG